MHSGLYCPNENMAVATQDLLNLLHERGVPVQTSSVAGGLVAKVNANTFESLEKAIQDWTAQQAGRHAKPEAVKFIAPQGEEVSFTITIHSQQAAT